MADNREILATSLVTRLDTFNLLRLWSSLKSDRLSLDSFFVLLGFVRYLCRVSPLHFDLLSICYRFERNSYVIKRFHRCALLWTHLTYHLKKNVNWKGGEKGKRNENERQNKADVARDRTISIAVGKQSVRSGEFCMEIHLIHDAHSFNTWCTLILYMMHAH